MTGSDVVGSVVLGASDGDTVGAGVGAGVGDGVGPDVTGSVAVGSKPEPSSSARSSAFAVDSSNCDVVEIVVVMSSAAVPVRVEYVAPVEPCHKAHLIGQRRTICGPSLQRRLRHKAGSALDGGEVGAEVGFNVGMFVGLVVGPLVFTDVGAIVRNVGDRVGRFVGTNVGDTDGGGVGAGVGAGVGVNVGERVGRRVGTCEGAMDGANVVGCVEGARDGSVVDGPDVDGANDGVRVQDTGQNSASASSHVKNAQ